jgi:hypothetical protein
MAYLLDFIELASYNKQKRGGYTGNNETTNATMNSFNRFHYTLAATLIATGIFATAPAVNAAITWGSFADTPTTLSGSAVWNSPPPSEGDTLVTPN